MKTTRTPAMQKLPGVMKLVRVNLIIALFIQLAIISYNHYSGYNSLSGLGEFLSRLAIGTALSFIALFCLSYPDLYLIRWLNLRYPWSDKFAIRTVLEITGVILFAVPVALAITVLSNGLNPYPEGLVPVLISNSLIFTVCNFIYTGILETWLSLEDNWRASRINQNLNRELSQIRFEVLRNQLNPHFMFNSLNVLSGLIDEDKEKAQEFIDEFSDVYRYVMETIEKPLVSLQDEIDFAKSYFFLQQLRYGNALHLDINIPSDDLSKQLPPLSLQVVLENAIKHNQVDQASPLQIKISSQGTAVVVENNWQKKTSSSRSYGVGQKNLLKRYAMVSKLEPTFNLSLKKYRASLPLLNNDESINS